MSREVEVTGKAIEGVRMLEEKATGFADEFDMDGRTGMLGMFPSSLTFHREPRTSYRICRNPRPLLGRPCGHFWVDRDLSLEKPYGAVGFLC